MPLTWIACSLKHLKQCVSVCGSFLYQHSFIISESTAVTNIIVKTVTHALLHRLCIYIIRDMTQHNCSAHKFIEAIYETQRVLLLKWHNATERKVTGDEGTFSPAIVAKCIDRWLHCCPSGVCSWHWRTSGWERPTDLLGLAAWGDAPETNIHQYLYVKPVKHTRSRQSSCAWKFDLNLSFKTRYKTINKVKLKELLVRPDLPIGQSCS